MRILQSQELRIVWKYLLLVAFPILVAQLILSRADAAGSNVSGGGLPQELWLQVVNFAIYYGAILFFVRKPVKSFFSQRKSAFLSEAKRAEQARSQAAAQKQAIAEKLQRLEAGANADIEKARLEAAQLKASMIAEAEQLAERLKDEARTTVATELALAKRALRDELLSQAIAAARTELKDRMADPDQKRLQTEFVDKMQVVTQ